LESIDIHSHLVIQSWFDDARKDFPDYIPKIEKEGSTDLYSINAGARDAGTTRHVPETITNVSKRLKHLKKLKIDLQAIAPIPSLLFHDLPLETSIALSRAQNDGISQVVKDNSNTFFGLCGVPIQDPQESVNELVRAATKLGMKGVEIPTNINGVNLDDRSLWPFYGKVQELGIPILVHPINIGAADRLQRYYLSNLIGNPLDTSIAIGSIVFGGVLQDFPRLKFLFVHGAGFTPYQRGRLDHGFEVRPEPKEHIKKKPSLYIQKINADTIVHYAPALEYLIRTFGVERILLGSDYPFDMGPKDPVGDLRKITLTQNALKKISSENARKLFKLGKN
jgi:aminocarboxymuconate-semialdehyde decarboxylase